MVSPRWMKLLRDLQQTPGRMMLIVFALAAGVFGLGTMLTSYTILNREIRQNYLATNPASATVQLDQLDAGLMAGVRAFPDIAAAQASTRTGARVQTHTGEWLPLTLFAVDNFRLWHINTVYPDSGAWPPPDGSILLEREVMPLLHVKTGDVLLIQNADGSTHQLTISGTAHNPGLPPPSQGLQAFAYATPATLNAIGLDGTLRSLEITVRNHPFDISSIEQSTSKLALWIRAQGHVINSISIPNPGEHPHNRIMTAILKMLLLFSCIALVLSAVLTATIMDSLLAQQQRQIGVMKALGATTYQIATVYCVFIACLGMLASLAGIPAGIAAGRAFARVVLENMLNFSLHNDALPGYVWLILIFCGVLLPICAAAVPVFNAARVSVLTALNNFGTGRNTDQISTFVFWLDRFDSIDRSLLMALRNSLRRRGRLILTLTLLALAGAMFISSLNVRKSSENYLARAATEREYDLEIMLSRPEDKLIVQNIIGQVAGVRTVEAWQRTNAAVPRADGLEFDRVYPDGSHGTLSVSVVPRASQMIHLTMQSGHWLNDGSGAVVLNQAATRFYPGVKSGDSIQISSRGHNVTVQVAGITSQAMAGAAIYIDAEAGTYQQLGGQLSHVTVYRVQMDRHEASYVSAITGNVEAALLKQGIPIRLSTTETMLRTDVDGHFTLLVNALLAIALLMAIIGIAGLGSVMSANLSERTREFGIMQSIGARPGRIVRNVIVEGVFTGLLSWVIALLVMLPVSEATGYFLGNLLFGMPFPFVVSAAAIGIWLGLVITGSVLASALPAAKAARLTIRAAFAANY